MYQAKKKTLPYLVNNTCVNSVSKDFKHHRNVEISIYLTEPLLPFNYGVSEKIDKLDQLNNKSAVVACWEKTSC